jgi:hypothetical protein
MVHDNWQKYLITMETYTHNEKIEWIYLMNIVDFIRDLEKDTIG